MYENYMYGNNYKIGLYSRLLGIYFFIVILGSMTLGSFGSFLKLYAYILVFACVIQKKRLFIIPLGIRAGAFFAWCAVTILWSIDRSDSISRAISQFSFLGLIIATSSYEYNIAEIDYFKRCLRWSSRLCAAIALGTGTYIQGRLLLSGIITENPNYLCGYLFFAITYDIDVLVRKEFKSSAKLLASIEILIYIYITFSTGSRGGFFGAVLVVLSTILIINGNKQLYGGSIIKIILLISAIVVGTIFISQLMPNEIYSRFTYNTIKTSNGSGRYELWAETWKLFKNSSFFRQLCGYGAGTGWELTFAYSFSVKNVIQNIYLETLIEDGIIGILLYSLYIGSFLVRAIKKGEIIAIAPFLGMLMLGMTSSIYSFKPYWNILLLIICLVRTLNYNEVKSVDT